MSDDASDAGDAGETSVEVQAPVETKDPAAEPKDAAPVKAKPVKPRTADDDFEDLLKKTGGLKYKAGGKEKSITTAADLKRVLSFADGANEAADRAAKQSREAESKTATINALAKMPPLERIRALESMGVSKESLREAFELDIVAADDKQKELANLTPEQRAFRQEREAFEAQRSEFLQQQEHVKRQQEEEAYVQRVTQTGERLTKVAVGALQKAKISGEHAPRFLASIADRLDRNERLGLELDESELAEQVMEEHGSLADQFYSGLEIPALAERLSKAEVDDPLKPGAKVSRLKLLMRHEAARIKAQMNGGQHPVERVVQAPQVQNGQRELTIAEKLAAARNFGSEHAWKERG